MESVGKKARKDNELVACKQAGGEVVVQGGSRLEKQATTSKQL
jgi:hypothetical protein